MPLHPGNSNGRPIFFFLPPSSYPHPAFVKNKSCWARFERRSVRASTQQWNPIAVPKSGRGYHPNLSLTLAKATEGQAEGCTCGALPTNVDGL